MASRAERDMACDACRGEVHDLRKLPCNHTFCLNCLRYHIAQQRNKSGMECPLCKMRSRVPEGGLQYLPVSTMYREQNVEKKTGTHRDQSQEQEGQDQLQHTMAGRNGREMVDMTDTCSICNVVFEDPRMLKCNHNFCFKCIKRCVAKQHYQTSMLCPICKAFSRFPKGKLDDIPSSELHSKQKWAEGHYDNSQGQKGYSDKELHQREHKTTGLDGTKLGTKECGICKLEFDDLQQLTCGHRFCLNCLQTHAVEHIEHDHKNEMNSPLCKKCTSFPEGKLKSLHIQQSKTSSRGAERQDQERQTDAFVFVDIPCVKSDCNRPATSFCKTCKFMCSKCEVDHNKVYSGVPHGLKTLEEGRQRDVHMLTYCSAHPNKSLKFYCENCEINICSKCFTSRHSGHVSTHLSEKLADTKHLLTDALKKLKHYIDTCEQMKQQTVDDFKTKAALKIESLCNELLFCKQEINNEVDRSYEKAQRDEKKSDNHDSVNDLKMLEYESSQLLLQDTLPDYISQVKYITNRLRALESGGIKVNTSKLVTKEAEEKLRDLKSYAEVHDQTIRHMDLEKENGHLKKQMQKQIETNEDFKTRYNSLSHMHDDLKKKYDNLAEAYGKSLASELAMDDSKSENISTQCRPSVLRDKYVHLSYQNAGAIKTSVPVRSREITKEFKCTYMDQVFSALYMTTCRGMTQVYNKQHKAIHFWLTQPISADFNETQKSENKSHPGEQGKPLTTSLLQALTKYTKDVSSDVIMTEAIKPILYTSLNEAEIKLTRQGVKDPRSSLMREIVESAVSDDCDKKEPWAVNLTEWIRSLCNLAWQMTLQNPPLTMETPRIGERIDLNNDKIIPPKNMDFDRSDEYVIDYYLEPHLMHGKELLEAGRVKVRLQTNTEPDVMSDRPSCDQANIRYTKPTDEASLEGSQKNRECSQKESATEYTEVKPESRIDGLNYKDGGSNSGHPVVINNKPQYSRKETPGHEHDGDDVDSAPGNELVVSDQMDYPRKTL